MHEFLRNYLALTEWAREILPYALIAFPVDVITLAVLSGIKSEGEYARQKVEKINNDPSLNSPNTGNPTTSFSLGDK